MHSLAAVLEINPSSAVQPEPHENTKHRHIQDFVWAVESGFFRDSGSQKGGEVRTALLQTSVIM